MKHFTFTIVALFLFIFGINDLNAQGTLYVKEKTGSQTAFTLAGIRKLTFSGSSMTVTKPNADTQNVALNGIRYLSFINYSAAIENQESNSSDGFRLYPNPVSTILQIEYTGKQSTCLKAEILDMQGRVLLAGQFQKRKAGIDVTGIKAGIYICRLQGNSNATVQKFIKN